MVSRFRLPVGPVVEFVGVSERRRATVAVGVALLFGSAVELEANAGVLPLVLAAGLAAYLYTRGTAQETLAAAAYGPGLLLVGLFLLQVYLIAATASTESLDDAVGRLFGWLLTALGIGIRSFGSLTRFWRSGSVYPLRHRI